LDSPHNRNALFAQLRRELASRWARRARTTPCGRVLTHAGRCSAGMDLKGPRRAAPPDQGVNEFPAILEQL